MTNPTDITQIALDTHADFLQVRNLKFTEKEINGGLFANKTAAENWINSKGFEYGDKEVAVPKNANDSLTITFKDSRGKVELMNNRWCERPEMNDEYVVVTPELVRKENAQSKLQKIYRDEQEKLEIPYGLMNGNYYTTIDGLLFTLCGNG